MKWKIKLISLIPAYIIAVLLLTVLIPTKKAGRICQQLFNSDPTGCAQLKKK
jgi:hypothetical protein